MNDNQKEIVFDMHDVDEGLSDKAKEIMSLFNEKTFDISKYVEDEKTYDDFIWTLLNNMHYGFEHREFRDCPVQYKFTDDDEVKWLPYRHFIINVIFWRPMICIDASALDDSFIIESTVMNKLGPVFIKNYFDSKYVIPYKRKMTNHKMNEILCDTCYFLSRISAIFNQFMGLSINIEVFIDLAKRIPEFEKLIYFKLDESKQPAEIERDLKEAASRQIQLILDDKKFNILKPLLQPNSGLNPKQFSEIALNIGLKPDIEGNIIPRPINTNYLTGNLGSITKSYINSISGRKVAIINDAFMGKTGHFAILVSMATASIKLSKTVDDCNTANPIPILVQTKNHLKKLVGRRYRYRGTKQYNPITESDTHLIGQTIYLRSPITCSAKDGICKECYGELFFTNQDNYVTGIYSATEVMNPVIQGILSIKHHQTTNSKMIKFDDDFYTFFTISATDIIINENCDSLSTHSLVLRTSEINCSDEESELNLETSSKKKSKRKKSSKDEESDNNTDIMDFGDDSDDAMETKLSYYVDKFEVVENLNSKTKKPKRYCFRDTDNKELYLHKDFINKMIPGTDENGDYLYINLEDISPEEFVFMVDVENNELTRPLKEIEKLLNNKSHVGCTTYEEIAQKMLDLIIESNLRAMSIHGEMIVRQLIRRSTNILRRPNFDRIVMPQDYELITINLALKKNPAITMSLSTPFLKDQLVSMAETFDKTETCVLDYLFMKSLDKVI